MATAAAASMPLPPIRARTPLLVAAEEGDLEASSCDSDLEELSDGYSRGGESTRWRRSAILVLAAALFLAVGFLLGVSRSALRARLGPAAVQDGRVSEYTVTNKAAEFYGARGGARGAFADAVGTDPFNHGAAWLGGEADANAIEAKDLSVASSVTCRDAECGSKCKAAVKWAMQIGIKRHPEWYGNLTQSSSAKDVQRVLSANGLNDCERPCLGSAPSSAPLPIGPLPVVQRVNATGGLPYGHPKFGFAYPERIGFTLWLAQEFDEPLDLMTDPIWTYSDGGLKEGSVRFVKDAIMFTDG